MVDDPQQVLPALQRALKAGVRPLVSDFTSITAGLIPRSLLRKELFADLLESVIPECFYRESRRDRNW